VDCPTIVDAVASFNQKYGKEIGLDYFEQYNVLWVDQLPIYQIGWFMDKLFVTQDVTEKWSDHIAGIYKKYWADGGEV
jgi:hypothetical protein